MGRALSPSPPSVSNSLTHPPFPPSLIDRATHTRTLLLRSCSPPSSSSPSLSWPPPPTPGPSSRRRPPPLFLQRGTLASSPGSTSTPPTGPTSTARPCHTTCTRTGGTPTPASTCLSSPASLASHQPDPPESAEGVSRRRRRRSSQTAAAAAASTFFHLCL